MIYPKPIVLERDSVRLEPMEAGHAAELATAAADGALWDLWFTSVPNANEVDAYIASALAAPDIMISFPLWIAWRSDTRGTARAASAHM